MTQTIPGPAIVRGHFYPPLQITVTGEGGVLFPDGVQLRAQVRNHPWEKEAIVELTTENGGLRRISDDTFELQLAADVTAKASDNSVILDLVRTDPEPDLYLYVQMTIPVVRPVTR